MYKKTLPLLLVLAMMMLGITSSFAATYGQNGGFGVSSVGTGGDYTNLYDAATDFNAVANTGNWTLIILNSLVETNNVTFANSVVPGNVITIKPASSTQPVITFSSITDNALAPSGHLIIGWKDLFSSNPATNVIPITQLVIDGSNNGTNSRDLTFTNQTTSYAGARLLQVIGACTGITVKNCNLINNQTASTAPYGLSLTTQSTGGTNVSKPESVLVTNNYIISTGGGGGGGGIGVGFVTRGTVLGAMGAMGTVTVSNNFITAGQRGIFLNNNASAVLSNNTVRVANAPSGLTSAAIAHASANTVSGQMDIYGNVIDSLQSNNATAAAGLIGIDASGAPASGSYTYNIYNNEVTGFVFSISTVNLAHMVYRGIQSGSTLPNLNIYYNSINMDNQPNLTALDSDSCTGISYTAATPAGTINIKNNIVRIAQVGGAAICKRTGTGSLPTSNFNDLYASGASSYIGRFNASTYTTLAAWQGVSFTPDLNSGNVDPTATSPGAWASAINLNFVGGSAVPLPPGTPISITTDIAGTTRDGSTPWPGAFEGPQPVPVELSNFSANGS